MKNKLMFLLAMVFAGLLLFNNSAFSEDVRVGNKICPVSGEAVESMGGGIEYTYKGRIYNLCCEMCAHEFEKDPEKYSAIAEAEVQHSKHTMPMDQTNSEHKGSHAEHDMTTEHQEKNLVPVHKATGEISHYTCGMHPSVKVSVENYKKGDTKCPICFMPLTPVIQGGMSSGELGEDVLSQVEIKAGELKLAGVQTEHVVKQSLFKEIRAVGRVAYDPQLAIAQDEFISAVRSYEKAKTGQISEIVERAESLIESSKRKLRLLGLNDEQIQELERTKEVQTSLILPGEKMWIYGDVYEYELNWIKEGSHIVVKPVGLAGEEFYGKIVSINPVVDPQTRSVRFRAMIDNPNQKLKPEMYVDVEIMSQYTDASGNTDVLSIPKSALLDTGRRTIVWVDKGNGKFEGRKVEIGPEAINHSDNPRRYYPVLKGLKEGEKVVTKGNFLIDSQSQITGVAASSFGGALESDHKGSTGHVH
jgi:multidrug efflux pump subunit AcrA (membrane-fusion protein)/YHS domain-containing protein